VADAFAARGVAGAVDLVEGMGHVIGEGGGVERPGLVGGLLGEGGEGEGEEGEEGVSFHGDLCAVVTA
jgi:hypothetical protein